MKKRLALNPLPAIFSINRKYHIVVKIRTDSVFSINGEMAFENRLKNRRLDNWRHQRLEK